MLNIEYLSLKEIIIDPKLQFREKNDPETVREYAELMTEDIEFDPVDVFRTAEGNLLVDGFQRMEAAQIAGKRKIHCRIHKGEYRDAINYALKNANINHGKRLTNADKRKKALFIFQDEELSKLSDNAISKLIQATQPSIGNWRREFNAEKIAKGETVNTIRTAVRKDGTTTEVDVSKVGRPRKEKNISKLPPLEETEETTSHIEENIIDQFIETEVDEDTSVEQYQNIKLGTKYKAGKHFLYFNDVLKVKKDLDEDYKLCLYVGDITKLIKIQKWFMELSDNVLIVFSRGEDVPKIVDLEYISNSGTLLSVNQRPYYLAHFSVENKPMSDLAVSTAALYMSEMLTTLTEENDSILLVDPHYSVLSVFEENNRLATITYTDPKIMQRDLIEWANRYGANQPITQIK